MGSSSRTKRTLYSEFSQGSLVEVQSNEEAYKDVYLTATVITFSQQENKILVEYQNLLDEEGKLRLRDQVPCSSVRPAPPQDVTGCFLPGEVVDVFYRNCWWKAVVARVIDDGGKCVVVRFGEEEEEHEFKVADVRIHLDWVNGAWRRFPNQEGVPVEGQGLSLKRKRGRPGKRRNTDLHTQVVQALDQGNTVLGNDQDKVITVYGSSTHGTDTHKDGREAAFGGSLLLPNVRNGSENSRILEFINVALGSLTVTNCSRTLEFIGKVGESMKEIILTDQSMPFSDIVDILWKPLESMFSFKWKPHFQGLLQKDRLLRIAGAIGSMVLFVAIDETFCDAETASKLDLSKLRNIMDILITLEVDGFDISFVRDRLVRLVAVKETQGDLAGAANELDRQISLHYDKRSRIENELMEYNDEKHRMEQEMAKLHEKISLAELAKDNEDSQIAGLQADLLETKEAIQHMELEFPDIASSAFPYLLRN